MAEGRTVTGEGQAYLGSSTMFLMTEGAEDNSGDCKWGRNQEHRTGVCYRPHLPNTHLCEKK